jgi:Chalcone isomerase-like
MKKIIFSLLIVGGLTSCGGNEEATENKEGFVTLEGASFPTELSLDSTKLVLNGTGLRKFLFIKVYVAGLYLPEKNRDEIKVIDADEPSVLRLHAISRAFTSERMANTVREQFEKSNKGHTAELQTRIDILCNRLAQETIEVGDECDISYTPNEGIRFAKNGKDINILLSGLDFKKALWNNFLGEIPAEEDLKKGLLGR